MPPPYTLRPVTDADYDFLYKLHALTIREAVAATWGWDEAFQRAWFRDRWNADERRIVAVEGKDIGTLTLRQHPDRVELALIEIHPAHQGRGIGSGIIRDIVAEAHARGLPVTLSVLKANPRARRLYERLGFTVSEERPERYQMVAPVP